VWINASSFKLYFSAFQVLLHIWFKYIYIIIIHLTDKQYRSMKSDGVAQTVVFRTCYLYTGSTTVSMFHQVISV